MVAAKPGPPLIDASLAEPADFLRIAVVEEERGPCLHRRDPRDLVVCQLEIEDVKVLPHPIGADRFWDYDGATLHEPAKDDLAHGLVVRLADGAQDRVREETVPAFCELRPGLVLTPQPRVSDSSSAR